MRANLMILVALVLGATYTLGQTGTINAAVGTKTSPPSINARKAKIPVQVSFRMPSRDETLYSAFP